MKAAAPMHGIRRSASRPVWTAALCFTAMWLVCLVALASVLENLGTLSFLVRTLPAGDPTQSKSSDGPKAIAAADLNLDGTNDLAIANTDGSVTVYLGRGDGSFGEPMHLRTGVRPLRDILAADLNGDGRPDLAVTAPFESDIYIFYNRSTPGAPAFQAATNLPAWYGARNLVAGDFDGDGRQDLVVAGPRDGLRQYRSLGSGAFQVVTNIFEVTNGIASTRFPRPVFSLKSFRPPGSARDQLVVTHAESALIWHFAPDAAGVLQPAGTIACHSPAYALEVAPLFGLTGGQTWPDLVAVERDAGRLEIFRGANGPAGFSFSNTVAASIDVPGGPREIEVVDIDGNGWNDLAIVARNFDTVITYANNQGTLQFFAERPVGTSPRDLVAARFNNDPYPDLAVINRESGNVSILLAYPQQPGFRGINHLYLTDGNVAGLKVFDFNGDGRDDVIQLHREAGDFSVRLANPDGTLGSPTYYTLGNIPGTQVFADVNKDGVQDQVSAHLGRLGLEKGFVTVRLGLRETSGTLTFGPETTYELPAGVEGRLFALVPADFNGDGYVDLAAGFLDSQVALFQNLGNGTFQFAHTHRFVDQARDLVAADFDRDGDVDLAAVGISGELWVVENPGHPATLATNLLLATSLTNLANVYPPPPGESFGGRRLIVVDSNGDSDFDLVLGSGKGAWLYLGGPELNFTLSPSPLAGTSHFISDLLNLDLDQDGNRDLVLACQGPDCLRVLTQTLAGDFEVPASRFIAVGDLDGDGINDLVGTGRVLWTVLSSRAPTNAPPLLVTGQRARTNSVVINEILAINTAWPVEQDGNRLVDWVEIFNGNLTPAYLIGWKLRSIGPDKQGIVRINEFTFPPTAFLTQNERRLVIFSEEQRSLYHTGFRLPGDAGRLELLNASGAVVDQVDYPAQRPNLSYARFRDGLRTFVFNPFPSPGKANLFNGLPDPEIQFGGVNPATFLPGLTSRFYADVKVEDAMAALTMYWQPLNGNVSPQQLALHDDGLHGDGRVSDSRFAGDLPLTLPAGSEIEVRFEGIDVNGRLVQQPEDPVFGSPGTPGNVYQLAFPANRPALELSEVASRNVNGLRDGTNTPDWVEIRNIGTNSFPLEGISLSQQIGDNARYNFPPGTILPPGGSILVFCDNDPGQGPQHAPFRLSDEGELLMLTGLTTNGSRTILDWVSFPALPADVAFARLGAGGRWRLATPTPGACNLIEPWLGFPESTSTGMVFTIAFPTTPNNSYTLQHAPSLAPGASWQNLQVIPGDGIEKLVRHPLNSVGFYRVRRDPHP